MKALILSSNNGGGHNAVAKAIAQCFTAHGDECTVRDCLSYVSDRASELVSRSHDFMYRHTPELFGSSYRRTEKNPEAFKEHHRVRQMIELGQFGLGKSIREEGFELVICTHVFSAIMLTAAKKRYKLPVQTALVETDYTNTPGSAENTVDVHFLPDASLIPDLAAAGVPEDQIVVSGIPVREEFYHRTEKEAAKAQLGLDPAHLHLLIMGGSMGCGPIPELLDALYLRLDEDVEISVVCGNNERLKKSLESSYGHLRNIHVLGYVAEMSSLYDSADLLMTKPGGISTTEAAVKGLPMILINAVAGCEAHNLHFFLETGGALTGETVEELVACCETLLEDWETLAEIKGVNPNFWQTYYGLGEVYRNLEQYESAISNYSQAIKLNPHSSESYNNRGVCYVLMKNYQQALNDATDAIRINPNFEKSYQLRGIIYKELGEIEKANADFAKAKELGFKG